MFTKHDFPFLRERIPPYLKRAATTNVLAALAASALTAGALLAFVDTPSPADSSKHPASTNTAATTNVLAEATKPPSDEICNRQAWPYIDRRCLESPNGHARKMREVRVVTSSGETMTIESPLPVVEAQRSAAPRRQAAAAIGPAAVPVKPDIPTTTQPQEKIVERDVAAVYNSAPAKKDVATIPRPDPRAATRAETTGAAGEETASIDRPAQTPETADAEKPAKSEKSDAASGGKAEDAKVAEQPQPKPRKTARKKNSVPDEVIAAVQAAAPRLRGRVPDEVIATVRSLTREGRGGRAGGDQAYAAEPMQRVYIVPETR